ncbi:peptide synthetase, siderophore biosynthesis protein [Streptomyces sp. SID685]|uniref:phosphopantetheine-binding protein n=1 Tax=Streptomyces sp. SID685 TaxID=2690322 RepID=UPI001370CCFD|nr:phosphopantetheine-binding protein [Streptomyces sp. SID685]MYR83682.1 peptide synthetase, siderophore biosynthesis protein [Streptomyces sp. SID685]
MSETTDQSAAGTMTATEAALAEMWRDLLDRPDIGREDDFFESGGTSLTAIKLLQRAEKRFGPDVLSPDTVYADARLRSLARAIDEAKGRD